MKILARCFCISAAMLLILFSTSCEKKASKIKIGLIAPLTGDAAVYGIDLKKGVDLAVDTYRQNPQNQKLAIISEDSKADPQTAISAVTKLINVDKTSVIIGDMFSATTLAIAPIAEKAHVVLLSPTASAIAVPNSGDYIFSIYPSDDYDGKFLGSFVSNNFPQRSIAIVYVQADAMITCKDSFRKVVENAGSKVLLEESYSPGATDFKTSLLKAKNAKPDLLFLPGYLNEVVAIIKQVKEMGITSRIITISTLYDDKLFELAGNAAEGVILSAPYFDLRATTTTVIDEFAKLYQAKYGNLPNVWAAYGFDAFNIIMAALGKTSVDVSLKDALLQIKNFNGVTGATTFLPNGGVEKQLRLVTIKNEQFVLFRQ